MIYEWIIKWCTNNLQSRQIDVDTPTCKIDTHYIDNNSSQFDIIWSHQYVLTIVPYI